MNKGLQSFVFLLAFLFAFSEVDVFGQGREGGGDDSSLPPVLKGQRNDTIPDLDSYYCSEGAADDIYVDPSLIPSGAVEIVWTIYTQTGSSNYEEHPTWVDDIGTAPENGIRFYPTRVDPAYYDTYIIISYQFKDGMGPIGTTNYDYTIVRETPDDSFIFGSSQEICLGSSASFTLGGSESGVNYYLYRDGSLVDPLAPPIQGTGSALSFQDTPSAIGTYQYSVRAQLESGGIACEVSFNDTPDVTVYPHPTISPTSNSPVCPRSTITLSDSNPANTNYSYTWTGPGLPSGGQSGHSISVTDASVIDTPGDYTYTLTAVDISNPAACDAVQSITVTVNGAPTVSNITNDGPACTGETVNISIDVSGGTGPYTYSWTGPNGFTSTLEDPVLSNVTLSDAGNYEVVVTDVNGCGSITASTTVEVNENPLIDDISNDGPACEGETINLSLTVSGGTGPYTYSWTGPNGFTSTLEDPVLSNITLSDAGNYNVAVTDANGCGSTTGTTSVEVNENPLIDNISNDGPVCVGETLNLLLTVSGGTGPYTYSWTGPNGFTSTLEDPQITNVTTSEAGQYNVSVTDANGCSAVTASTTVDVSDPVIDNISNDGPACEGGTISLSVQVSGGIGSYTYSWTGPNGFTSTLEAPQITNVTTSEAGAYSVEVTDAEGCVTATGTTTVEVNENPLIDDISNDGPACEGETINLSLTVSGGTGPYTYSWTGPNGFTSTLEDPVLSNITLSDAGDYNVTVTDANGCGSTTGTTAVEVNENPLIDNISNDGPVCVGGTLNLLLTVSGGTGPYTYSWTGPNGFTSTLEDPQITNVTTSEAGQYNVSVTDANGCSAVTASTTVDVSDPVIDNISNDGPACEGGTISLSVQVSGGIGSYTYSWTGPNGFTSTLEAPQITNVTTSEAGAYSVEVTDAEGCVTATGTTTVEVNENPLIDNISNDGPACEGETINLSLTVSGGTGPYTYSWTGPNGFTSTLEDPVLSNITLSDAGNYNVTVTDAKGCGSTTGTTTVEVNENPLIDNISNDGPVCVGGTLNLLLTVSGGTGPYTYSWTGPNGFTSTLEDPQITNVTTSEAGQYNVSVTDANGCSIVTASTTVVVNGLSTVNLPDASTCDGEDITLSAVASGGSGNYVNYVWYDGSGNVIASGTSSQLTLTGADVALANDGATYSVTVEDDNGCASAPDDMTLTVNENPTVQINSGDSDIDVCLGGSLTLNANVSGGAGPYNYTWELPDGSTQAGSQLIINPATVAADGVYVVTVEDGSSCSGTAQVQINVVEIIPTWSVSATSICPGTEVTFTAGGGSAYEFFHYDASAGTTTSVQGPGVDYEWKTTGLEDGDKVFATVSNSLGCSENTDTTEIKVYPTPTVSIKYPSGLSNEVCQGINLQVIADPAGYSTYDFYIFDGTNDILVSSPGNSSNTFEYPASSFEDGDEFYVVASSGAGCSGESAHETVVVHSLPTVSASNDGPKCEGFDIKLQGGVAGLSYDWFSPGADIDTDTPIASTMDYDLTGVTLSDAGKYILRVTDANGCQNSDTTEVVVHEVPEVDLGSDITACEGTYVNLTATVTGGTSPFTYSWEKDGVSLGASGASYEMTSITLTQAGKYKVTVEDANGCVSAVDSVQVIVNPAPTVSVDYVNTVNDICDGEQVVLKAEGADGAVSGSDPSGYKYEWYYKDGASPDVPISGETSAQYSFTGEYGVNDGRYEVIAIDDNGNGCASAPVSVGVTVHELPNATLTANPAFFIEGTNVDFTAGGGNEYTFYVNGAVVQARGTNNSWSSATLVDGDSVSVEVFENHGSFYCENFAYIKMTVFDSVDKPTVNVTNAGYCEGEAGATVTVTNPQKGVTYEIVLSDESATSYTSIVYDGVTPVQWTILDANAPSGTDFRVKAYWDLVPAKYEVSDAFTITEHALPLQHSMTVDDVVITGNKTVTDCNSGTGYKIGLDSWNSGVDYILMLNGSQPLDTITGSASPLIFGYYSYIGTYTIYAVNSNNCTRNMTGSFTITGSSVTTFDLLPLDGRYCEGSAGVEISLAGSENGVNYELFRDGVSLTTVTGNGSPVTFGIYTDEGRYRVQVTTSGGCIYLMNNDVDVKLVPTPDAGILAATPDNHYCVGGQGVRLQLSGQQSGLTYSLMHDGNIVSTHTGNSSGINVNFINNADATEWFSDPGDYYVISKTDDLGCQSSPGDTVTVATNPLPENRPILGDTAFCEGNATDLYIENSQLNVEYQLYDVTSNSPYGSPQSGNGSTLNFIVGNESSYTIYTVNTLTGCERPFLEDTVNIVENDLPDKTLGITVTYVDTASANPCGTEEAFVSVLKPEKDVTYYLWKYGNSSPARVVAVPSASLDSIYFQPGIKDNNGSYYVTAVSKFGCVDTLSAVIPPITTSGALTVYGLKTDDDNICQGDGAVTISTTGSDSGINYALRYRSSGALYQDRAGTNDTLQFAPPVDANSTFYLEATDPGTGCTMVMDSVKIEFYPLPKAFELTGSGIYCGSSSGATIGLSGSEFGVDYHLIEENSGQADIKEGLSSGGAITFDNTVGAGIYTVFAKNQNTGCTSSMKDSIKVKNMPDLQTPDVDGDTLNYCSLDYSTKIILPASTSNLIAGATYGVFAPDGTLIVENKVASASSDLELGPVTEGKYVVRAYYEDGGCVTAASDTIWIFESLQPIVSGALSSNYSACYGDSVYISYNINGDDPNWQYSIVDNRYNPVLSRSDAILDADSLTWYIKNRGDYYLEVSNGVCSTDYSGRVSIKISNPIATPVPDKLLFNYCHNESSVDIPVVSGGGTSILYHLYDAATMNELTNISPIYSGGSSSPVFEGVSQGSYVIKSDNLSTGCFSEASDTVDVVPFDLPTDTVFWFDLTGTQDNIEYLSGGSLALTLDMSVLDTGFDYIVQSQRNDLYSFDVNDNNGKVVITQRGDDYFVEGIYSTSCPAYPVTLDALSVREDSIYAHDAYIYLSEGENKDTVTVNVEYTSFDDGYLEYFFLNGDTAISMGLVGDFNINPNTGFVTFNKAPSFYGADKTKYVVRNKNYPERVDTAYIYVYVGNSDLSKDKSIFVPNAFSPNGDGFNDYFVIESNRSITDESTLEIFNRWGNIVYRSVGKEYGNDWDGTSNLSSMVSIGKELPNGVYFYVYTITANVDGEIVNKKFNGYIELRR